MKIKRGVSSAAYERGYKVVQEKGCVICAMSIGNSYFNKESIDVLLPFYNKTFSQTKILIADRISIHTYKALGHTEKEARKKTRLAGNLLKNACERTMQKIRCTGEKVNISFVEWEGEIEHDSEYERQLEMLERLYDEHDEFKEHVKQEVRLKHEERMNSFRKDARETTASVLKGKLNPEVNLEKAVDEGVRYLLEELAFILAAPKIFEVEEIAYIYHREWSIFTNLVDGKYDERKKENVAFIQTED